MFYLFILESIGTSELLLIGLVALIIFGPRKLPELARTLGKAMNEFRRTTDDFKETWSREVDFEKEENQTRTEPNQISTTENSVQRNNESAENKISAPEIRAISQADFEAKMPEKENNLTGKRDWL